MFSNTKLLVTICFLVMALGIGFLWFGFEPFDSLTESLPSQTPFVKNSEIISTPSSSEKETISGERGIVVKVVDGDTLQLQSGQTIRFIGIDTPETVDPRRPVGCFGKEASQEAKNLLLGKEIVLEKDVSDTDKYQRLLR